MWLSTRCRFQQGDTGWADYVRFIGLPSLREVRSLDSALNKYVADLGSCPVTSLIEALEMLPRLPRTESNRQFYLLALDAETEKVQTSSSELRLLGHDLSDETHTSSLLNCGPWTGELAAFVPRLNQYGLLTFDDAIRAKALLPAAWPGDPHANVTVWALYEVVPAAGTS
jgi:hypothetical protein